MRVQAREGTAGVLTWKVPWIELVDVDVGDDGDRARHVGGAVAEVVEDELLVRRVEPEPRRQHVRVRHDHYWLPAGRRRYQAKPATARNSHYKTLDS